MHIAEFWIEQLQLQPHPEGGFFKETYRSNELLQPGNIPGFKTVRNFSTAIYFLLRSSERSVFHRIKSDEIWHYHSGGSLKICVLQESGLKYHLLGSDLKAGQQLQVVIPANHWFGAFVESGDYVLSSCTVAPGFDFEDFEMASRARLLAEFPTCADAIVKLTHD